VSWWGSFKNIYGLIMGTSTDIMKREDRPHWPTAVHKMDDHFAIQLGGTGNCGILRSGNQTLLINCGKGSSCRKLHDETYSEEQTFNLIGTSKFSDYIGGRDMWDFEMVWAPELIGYNLDQKTATAVDTEIEIFFAGETLHIIPVRGAFSNADLMVYLEERKTLFLGGLLYNGIHPILDAQRGKDAKLWQDALRKALTRWPVETVVPHEGDLCGPQAAELFLDYLRSLADSEVEFRHCRENFDWIEIPGQTSLEENFNHFRK